MTLASVRSKPNRYRENAYESGNGCRVSRSGRNIALNSFVCGRSREAITEQPEAGTHRFTRRSVFDRRFGKEGETVSEIRESLCPVVGKGQARRRIQPGPLKQVAYDRLAPVQLSLGMYPMG